MTQQSNFSFRKSFPNHPHLWPLDKSTGSNLSPNSLSDVYNSLSSVYVHDDLPDDLHHLAFCLDKRIANLPFLSVAGPDSRVRAPSYPYWQSFVSRTMKLKGQAASANQSGDEVTRDPGGMWAVVKGGPFIHSFSSDAQEETRQAVSQATPYITQPFVLKNDTSLCWASSLPDEQLKLCRAAGLTCVLSLNKEKATGGWNATADTEAFFKFLDRTKQLGIPVTLIRSDFLNITVEHQGELEDGNEMLTQPLHPYDHNYFMTLMHKTMSESLRRGGRAMSYLKGMTPEATAMYMQQARGQASAAIKRSMLNAAEDGHLSNFILEFSSRSCDAYHYLHTCQASNVHDARFDAHVANDPIKDRLGDVAAIALEHPELSHLVKHIPVIVTPTFELVPSNDKDNNVFLAVSEPDVLDAGFRQKVPQQWEWFRKLAANSDVECKTIVDPAIAMGWKVYTEMGHTVFSACLAEVEKQLQESTNGDQQQESTGRLSIKELQQAEMAYKCVLNRLSSGKMTSAAQGVFTTKGWQWEKISNQ